MHRTSIMLPDSLKTQVVHLAHEEGVSLGQFIRESLELRLKHFALIQRRDSLFAEESVFCSKQKNLSENHDDYLY